MSKKTNPPVFAKWILTRMGLYEERYSISGDFEEYFYVLLNKKNKRIASRWYWTQVIKTFPRFLHLIFYRSIAMFNNYMKISFRNIKKHKLYSSINIIGFSFGIAFFILLFNFLRIEAAYDNFHENPDDIYRVLYSYRGITHGSTSAPLGTALIEEIPEIESSFRFFGSSAPVMNGNDRINENILLADPEILNVLNFPLTVGTFDKADFDLRSIYISENMAIKYFNDQNPVGQTLTFDLGGNRVDFVVKGVLEKIPENSSLKFDILVHFEILKEIGGAADFSNWTVFDYNTMIYVNENTDKDLLKIKLRDFKNKHFPPVAASANVNIEDFDIILQPFSEYHFGSVKGNNGLEPIFNFSIMMMLFALAVLVLLMATINFTNLSLARISARLKEISIRKVLGAQKKQLIRQFVLESIMMIVFSLLAGLIIHEWMRPIFSEIMGKNVISIFAPDLLNIIFYILLVVVLGIITGSYPAYVISKYQPIEAISGKIRSSRKSRLTKSLVVFQYGISFILITVTIYMYQQMNYIVNMDLGYNHDNIVVLNTGVSSRNRMVGESLYQAFKTEIISHPNIENATVVSSLFGKGSSGTDVTIDQKTTSIFVTRIDEDFLTTMDINLLEGRNFDPDLASDVNNAIIVNDTFVKTFKIENPVNNNFPYIKSGRLPNNPKIVGVVKDFNFLSLKNQIQPVILTLNPLNPIYYIVVKISPEYVSESLALLESIWKKVAPERAFQMSFMSDDLNRQYRNEHRFSKIISYSAIMGIIISSLGLFALAEFTTRKRRKEIGIRKVLGSSNNKILYLIFKDFILLIFIASAISLPFISKFTDQWARLFAINTNFGLSSILIALGITIFITFVSIGYQALKAARENPVKVLSVE